MDMSLAPTFEALFHSFSHEDWDLLIPCELKGLSYYQNIWVQLGLLQWLINHFDPSNNLFHHNDFNMYLYRFWLQAYFRVDADLESTDLLTARFLLGPSM
ncbi:hypothetical protein JCGZ_03904 [Jatropha curcas]|uniref:Uncharacterized protein n=1 Tax=Jatropha curcas TaxID=180498 RepID=A0A067LF42_JATCU|nr:hypothetical protein JCGZ_03904 [Jatropha curcas]